MLHAIDPNQHFKKGNGKGMFLEFNGGRVFGKSWIPQAEFPSTPFDILKIGNGKWTFLGRKEERVKGE